ncbi:MAG: hypothetical protein WA876_04380 [Candidatus Acidiferrales bacterium]
MAVIGAAVVISARTGITIRHQQYWLAAWTVFLLWVAIKTYRRYWKHLLFWLALAILLGGHLALFTVILRNFPDFRPVWYIPVLVAEGAVFGVIYGVLLDRPKRRVAR